MKFPMRRPRFSMVFFLLIAAAALAVTFPAAGDAKGPAPASQHRTFRAEQSGSPVLLAAAKSRKKTAANFEWKKTGEKVYNNICAACHQPTGQGLPGTFPPLKGNEYVTAKNPRNHILTVLNGAQGKKIGGVTYSTPMPPFSGQLSDAEIAAVVNHERTSWGNHAPLVTPADVKKLRGKK